MFSLKTRILLSVVFPSAFLENDLHFGVWLVIYYCKHLYLIVARVLFLFVVCIWLYIVFLLAALASCLVTLRKGCMHTHGGVKWECI